MLARSLRHLSSACRSALTSSSVSSLPASRAMASKATSVKWGSDGLIEPHGGRLVNRMEKDAKKQKELLSRANTEIKLNERQLCDVELLMNGGFSPLEGFMNEEVYKHVVEKMRLPGSNLLFGLPIVFDTNRDDIKAGQRVSLTYDGQTIAVLDVDSRYTPNKPLETLKCYGTSALEHPGVQMVAMERGHTYLGGKITGFKFPKRVFACQTPQELRATLPKKTDIVVFQCRNPVHRAHYELFIRSLDATNVANDGIVLVHPTCGPTQADDIPGIVRYETYEVLKKQLNNPRVKWAYLPYSMHMAGPREAIQHMMMRKNYGLTHFIIGRDMAGSKSSVTGVDFYTPYEAQDFAKKHAPELGMETVPSLNLVHTAEHGYITAEEAEAKKVKPSKLSGTEFRRKLRAGESIPEWFAFSTVVEVLRKHVKSEAN